MNGCMRSRCIYVAVGGSESEDVLKIHNHHWAEEESLDANTMSFPLVPEATRDFLSHRAREGWQCHNL